jgi:hypothetical protein
MGVECGNQLMEIRIQDSGRMEKLVAMDYILGEMEIGMKVIGLTV